MEQPSMQTSQDFEIPQLAPEGQEPEAVEYPEGHNPYGDYVPADVPEYTGEVPQLVPEGEEYRVEYKRPEPEYTGEVPSLVPGEEAPEQ